MAYFVPAGGTLDVDQLRSSADALTTSVSGVFTQEGSYYYRVDDPLIGETFGFLSDVSIVDFGSGSAIIENVTQLINIEVFQVARNSAGEFVLVSSSGTSSPQIDQVLGNQFPSYINNSHFETFTMGPGQSSSDYLPEFYIRVAGNSDTFDSVYGSLGFNAPDDGRFLVTRGSVSGQRDAAWGSWLDTIHAGENPPDSPPPPVDPPLPDFDENLQPKLDEAKVLFARLDGIAFELDAQRARLSALDDQWVGETVTLALKGAVALGSLAQVYLGAYLPAGPLKEFMRAVNLTNSAVTGVKAVGDAVDGDTTLQEFAAVAESSAAFLVDATRYEGQLGNWFSAVVALRDSYDFLSEANNYVNSTTREIRDNISNTTERIHELEQQQLQIEQEIRDLHQEINTGAIVPLSINETPDAFEIASDSGRLILNEAAGDQIHLSDSDGGVSSVLLLSDKQTVVVDGGISMIDGSLASRDTVAFEGSIHNYVANGYTDIGFSVSGSDTEALVFGVDRIQFDDSTIALDTDGNAGQAYRIYQAAFDRQPDQGGLGFWISALDHGQGDINWVAANFINSNEFRATYGEPGTVSNEQFLTLLYANVLDRTPDQGGLTFWINQMNSGMSREKVLAHFSESAENQTNVIGVIQHGIEYTNWVA